MSGREKGRRWYSDKRGERELVGGGLPTQCGYLQNNNEETENMKGDFYI